ncbi:MAG: PilZ domain-containing protein [Thermodesulfobacteriota bacterium]
MNEASISTEKRQSPRVKTSIPVRYRELRDGAEAVGVGSLTSNVSTGGLRFGTDQFISTARRLILEFDIPSLTQPIKAVSQVAWIQKANGADDYQYQVGSQFMEITRKDQELIGKYLNGL